MTENIKLEDIRMFRPVLYSASVGCAWSGTMRGLLHVERANGSVGVVAECVTPDAAAELARKLNLANLGSAARMRNVSARRELMELKDLAEMLPGRDNKNNWVKKLDWLLEQFLDEPAELAEEREAAVMVHS